ncbi:MAG: chromate resistance protein [Thermaerobacter sp.]|nr:chromate resistance protein [Thermaerobacter sp.]
MEEVIIEVQRNYFSALGTERGLREIDKGRRQLTSLEEIQMKWVTRKNANVDRIACPWLIRRFVDTDAEFLFVGAEEVMAVAEREGATPFDVSGVELGHVQGRCSFESIMLKYGLDDPGLQLLAKIVHGADIAADIDIVPQAAGLKAIAHGFALAHGEDDQGKIRLETPLYDALYLWCKAQHAGS